MYPCLLLKVLAEFDLQLCTCSESPAGLCSCTLSAGIHAQVTSQRGSETPRKNGKLRSGEDNRILPGLDPWTAQWLAALLCRLSVAKQMMTTSFMEMNHMRRITDISMSYTVSRLASS